MIFQSNSKNVRFRKGRTFFCILIAAPLKSTVRLLYFYSDRSNTVDAIIDVRIAVELIFLLFSPFEEFYCDLLKERK